MSTTLKDKAVSGIKWSAIGQFGVQGITMVSSIVLARILSPKEFGLMAILTVMTGFASLLGNFGLGTAIVQAKQVTDEDLSSVFWVNLSVGIFLFLVFLSGSTFIANFYNDIALGPLASLIAFNFIFGALAMIHTAILDRRLAFKELAICNFSSVGISYCLAIVLAKNGFGVWSLAIQSVANAFIMTMLLWYFSKWRPRFVFYKNSINKFKTFGFHLLSINLFDYVANNLDTVIIGKYINKKQLGEYGRSYAFLMLPVVNVSAVITKVIFPTLSQIQDDKAKVADIYFRAARVLAIITFPMMIGLAILAHSFVFVVFGEKWLGMVPMLQYFSIIGIFASFNALHEPVILSQGKITWLFKLAPFEKGLLIISVIIGLNWGIFGIIICKAFAVIFISFPKFWLVSKTINVSFFSIYKNLLPATLNSIVMGLVVWVFKEYIYINLSQLQVLTLGVGVGIVTFVLSTLLFNRKVIDELKSLI